jgi:hypothetical protein
MISALITSFINLLGCADFSQPAPAGRVGMVLPRGTTHDGGPGDSPSPARSSPLFFSNLSYNGGEYHEG